MKSLNFTKNQKSNFGYIDVSYEIKAVCIIFSEMSGRTGKFDETKCMSFLIADDALLEKCNKIWDKVSNTIKKNLIVNLLRVKNI